MQSKHLSAALVCACVMGILSAASAVIAETMPMEKAAYKAGKTRVNNLYRADKGACILLTNLRQYLCIERATAAHRVARAELKYDYTGTSADRNRLQMAQAETGYAVAMEKCLPLAGPLAASPRDASPLLVASPVAASPRDACLGQARVAFGRI
ncbi:MAG: hypothetical protein LH632_21455 [Rhodoferax sp.]|nr:hypothetical protein [Rhodoferax sp.]